MKIRASLHALALFAVSATALAGPVKPFTQAEFTRLTQAGQPVVLDAWASWCPTCQAQKPVLEKLMARPEHQQVTLLRIDFDGDNRVLRQFKISQQSTLIGFRGGKEVARSLGDTSESGIDALIRQTER